MTGKLGVLDVRSPTEAIKHPYLIIIITFKDKFKVLVVKKTIINRGLPLIETRLYTVIVAILTFTMYILSLNLQLLDSIEFLTNLCVPRRDACEN